MSDMKFTIAYLKNIGKGMIPLPIAAILDAIDECESEEDLKEKFNELKEAINSIKTSFSTIPISFEAKYASVISIYYWGYYSNPDNIKNGIEEFLENELEDKDKIDYGYLESLDVVIVDSECIIIENVEPILKECWDNGIIRLITGLLEKEFDIKIRSIAFA